MRIIKILLVAGMALMLTLAALGNFTMSHGAFIAVQGALGMKTTYLDPHGMWRAIDNPTLIWIALGVIVFFESTSAVLCWIGAVSMWRSRASRELFETAKNKACIGLGVAACLYFIGFLVIAQEYFLMWQSTKLNVLPGAFRIFAEAMLICIWLKTDD